MPAPIVLFCFNRPEHLIKTISALGANSLARQSKLFVFSDAPREGNLEDEIKVKTVRALLKETKGFSELSVFEQKENQGLAKSVISGVSKVFEDFDKLIVLEDDMLVSSDFLEFMNLALDKYQAYAHIGSVSGYSYQLEDLDDNDSFFLTHRASSWGWGTWKDRWQKVDWEVSQFSDFMQNRNAQKEFIKAGSDQLPMLVKQRRGVIDSWAIRWTFHHYLDNRLCLVPKYSKVNNIGTDGSGTNFRLSTKKYHTSVRNTRLELPDEIQEKDSVNAFIQKRFSPSLLRKVINYLKYSVWY